MRTASEMSGLPPPTMTASEMSGGLPPTLTASESGRTHNNYWHKCELLREEMEHNIALDKRLALMLVPAALAAIGLCAWLLVILT